MLPTSKVAFNCHSTILSRRWTHLSIEIFMGGHFSYGWHPFWVTTRWMASIIQTFFKNQILSRTMNFIHSNKAYIMGWKHLNLISKVESLWIFLRHPSFASTFTEFKLGRLEWKLHYHIKSKSPQWPFLMPLIPSPDGPKSPKPPKEITKYYKLPYLHQSSNQIEVGSKANHWDKKQNTIKHSPHWIP